MNEVAETDHKGVIEMHIYCPIKYKEGDARSTIITMLQSINHANSGVNVFSGTRVKSHFAKPNWRTVYKCIALNHPNATVGSYKKDNNAASSGKSLEAFIVGLAIDFFCIDLILAHETATSFYIV